MKYQGVKDGGTVLPDHSNLREGSIKQRGEPSHGKKKVYNVRVYKGSSWWSIFKGQVFR